MTPFEFDQWFTYHLAQFTGAVAWLAKFPEVSRAPGDPSQRHVTDAWRNTLREVELKYAKEATTLLAEGREEFPERGYDCHPRTVRAIAMRLAGARKAAQKHQKMISGQEVYDCPHCRDTGFVRIYHPTLLRFFVEHFSPVTPPRRPDGAVDWKSWYLDPRYIQAKKEAKIKAESGAAKCSCKAGQVKRAQAVVFDPENHVAVGDGDILQAIESTEAILEKRGGF